MILFLRNKHNQSIVDIELYINDDGAVELYPSVIIEKYSKFLLENLNIANEIISDFSAIDDLRGWLWESYFGLRQNTKDEYDNVLEIVRTALREVANKYNLSYVED